VASSPAEVAYGDQYAIFNNLFYRLDLGQRSRIVQSFGGADWFVGFQSLKRDNRW
jgi:hypothetical protein